ncbi:hypothetical protein [Bacillus piscicola]|uniref:hypothetical protein n=1 Tax=Bacillus piscicola TaxID=1632684 RepID=UPI001F092413|nr:hypothetical protein [Bacillus piscicola]
MIRYLFLSAIFLYILSNFVSSPFIGTLLSIASLLAVVSSIVFVKRIVLAFGVVFLGIGSVMLIGSGAGAADFLYSFGPMLNLLTLFALIPILSLPIKLGNYAKDVTAVIHKKIHNSGQLYMVSSGISYFLSSFMNLAALPMTYYSIRPSADSFEIKNKERFMSRSITHGFAMPTLWTPVTPIVGVVIEMTGVNYSSMLPILVPFSILGLLLDWSMAHLVSRRSEQMPKGKKKQQETGMKKKTAEEISAAEEQPERSPFRRLFHILAAIIILNIVILIIEQFFDLSFIFLISLLVIPFSFTWTLLLGKGVDYVSGLKNHFQTHVLKMKDQFFLFLSAGFFISAINVSGADQTINHWISALIDVTGVQVFLVILPMVPVALAFIGLHPAVAFVLIVEALNPEVLGISPLVMTIAMLGSAVPSFLMGPYNATIGVMSNIIDKNPFKISNWNFTFCSMYMVLLILFLQAAQFTF